jgi:hypothetical protein
MKTLIISLLTLACLGCTHHQSLAEQYPNHSQERNERLEKAQQRAIDKEECQEAMLNCVRLGYSCRKCEE